mmetsp:Transcript_90984/g.229375  ORF Transcript_90984/g.229375 Transcript_90984/m.229375 type:complete len:249 (-) Transcript_90984:555-1301(-)
MTRSAGQRSAVPLLRPASLQAVMPLWPLQVFSGAQHLPGFEGITACGTVRTARRSSSMCLAASGRPPHLQHQAATAAAPQSLRMDQPCQRSRCQTCFAEAFRGTAPTSRHQSSPRQSTVLRCLRSQAVGLHPPRSLSPSSHPPLLQRRSRRSRWQPWSKTLPWLRSRPRHRCRRGSAHWTRPRGRGQRPSGGGTHISGGPERRFAAWGPIPVADEVSRHKTSTPQPALPSLPNVSWRGLQLIGQWRHS